MREHGGNLDAAVLRFGGKGDAWIDLSTGINPVAYPVPQIPDAAWSALPRQSAMHALEDAARAAFGTTADVVAFAGAQGAIQAVPWVAGSGRAAVLTPTYNEHAGALRAAGWSVKDVAKLEDLAGFDLAVVVNPNNPDGQTFEAGRLRDLAAKVGLLVVDESFVDCMPGLSMCSGLGQGPDNIVVLRSFGKFYGLAGLRLGFAVSQARLSERFRAVAGPWPVSGPAIEVATDAYRDGPWAKATVARLQSDTARLDAVAAAAGWRLVGGTPLFRTYAVPDASALQDALAAHHVWIRIFSYSTTWIRLGLPRPSDFDRLEAAIRTASQSGREGE